MFDFVRKHTRVMQFVLVLLIFPSFVFFGVQGYESFRDGSREVVAEVGGQEITRAQWDAAHRSQVERMRQQMPDLDASMLDSPTLDRKSVV
jgi:peptidyl-prolyl cis-trans isomerase D